MNDKRFYNYEMAYDCIRNCLQDQRETARSYTNRALTMFATGTAIAGIGLSFAFANVDIASIWIYFWVKVFLILPTVLYIMMIAFTYHAIKSKPIVTLDNPNGLGDEVFYNDTEKFYHKILERIRELFNVNQEVLDFKADSVKALIVLLPLLATSTAFAVAIFLTF